MHPEWIERLTPYLDDELDLAARAEVERHLAGCPGCARVLAELAQVVRAAREYRGHEPPVDLWPRIAAGIEASRVVPFARPGPVRSRGRRALALGLAAAGLLAVGIGGGRWLARDRGPAPVVEAARPAARAERVAVSPVVAGPAYSAAIADLESTLRANRSKLDTTTVRIVEESLRTIDRAIAEAQAAIQRDSANAYLNDQIAANMRRKLALLRLAARAASKET